MPHELPPHFRQIKADEARYFAEKSQREDSLDLRLRITKLERELKYAAIEIAELRHQIRETIMENLHLADGDDCTLKRLKDAISFELEDSCENAEAIHPESKPASVEEPREEGVDETTCSRSFRAGDTVHHDPSHEAWILAADEENGRVQPCGWPESIAEAKDCWLLVAASDEDRLKMLNEWAKTGKGHEHERDSRTRAARR